MFRQNKAVFRVCFSELFYSVNFSSVSSRIIRWLTKKLQRMWAGNCWRKRPIIISTSR